MTVKNLFVILTTMLVLAGCAKNDIVQISPTRQVTWMLYASDQEKSQTEVYAVKHSGYGDLILYCDVLKNPEVVAELRVNLDSGLPLYLIQEISPTGEARETFRTHSLRVLQWQLSRLQEKTYSHDSARRAR